MPQTTDSLRLIHGTVSELWTTLGMIMASENNQDALVLTEVGLKDGHDVYLAGLAQTIRVEYGGRVIISANERETDR